MRKCKCGETDITQFNKDRSRPGGYAYICRKCERVKSLKYEQEHVESIKAAKQVYRTKNRERRNKYYNAWAKANRQKMTAKTARRLAAQEKRVPSWLTEEDWALIHSFYAKAAELTKNTGIPHEVDHIIPLRGENISGLHVPSNLQVLTKHQNAVKSNKY
jgi:5-methylcytosine-specific restriction endonuclease McrA